MGETIIKGIRELFSKENLSKLGSVAQDFIDGQVLVRSYFTRHLWFIFVCVIFCIVYISSRYEYDQNMRTRRELELKIDTLQYVLQNVSAEYTEKKRESIVEDIVREMLPELQVLRTPATEINTNTKK